MLSFPKASKNIKESINNAADQIGTLFATMHLKTPGMIIKDAAEQLGARMLIPVRNSGFPAGSFQFPNRNQPQNDHTY